jgi:hypothetical protein
VTSDQLSPKELARVGEAFPVLRGELFESGRVDIGVLFDTGATGMLSEAAHRHLITPSAAADGLRIAPTAHALELADWILARWNIMSPSLAAEILSPAKLFRHCPGGPRKFELQWDRAMMKWAGEHLPLNKRQFSQDEAVKWLFAYARDKDFDPAVAEWYLETMAQTASRHALRSFGLSVLWEINPTAIPWFLTDFISQLMKWGRFVQVLPDVLIRGILRSFYDQLDLHLGGKLRDTHL